MIPPNITKTFNKAIKDKVFLTAMEKINAKDELLSNPELWSNELKIYVAGIYQGYTLRELENFALCDFKSRES